MRIASFQFIQRNLNNISGRTSEANQQLGQMSSGKRVEHASDDPVAANGILNYKQELRKLDQYQNNINLAENRLRREEWALSSAETLTQQVKEIMLEQTMAPLPSWSGMLTRKNCKAASMKCWTWPTPRMNLASIFSVVFRPTAHLLCASPMAP